MRNTFRIARWLSLSGLVMAVILQTSAYPLVVRVYDPSGGRDFAAMKNAAATLVERASGQPGSGSIGGFSYEIAEGPLVPARFSSGGGATYIWSSNTLKFESGFDFRATPLAFGKKAEPKLAKEEAGAPAPAVAWKTGFGKAVLTATALQLEYELAKGEVVTAALFDARGKTLASWRWREAGAGRFAKSFSMNHPAKTGLTFLRWQAGNVRLIRQVRME